MQFVGSSENGMGPHLQILTAGLQWCVLLYTMQTLEMDSLYIRFDIVLYSIYNKNKTIWTICTENILVKIILMYFNWI